MKGTITPARLYPSRREASAAARPGEWVMKRETRRPSSVAWCVVTQEERLKLPLVWVSVERKV